MPPSKRAAAQVERAIPITINRLVGLNNGNSINFNARSSLSGSPRLELIRDQQNIATVRIDNERQQA